MNDHTKRLIKKMNMLMGDDEQQLMVDMWRDVDRVGELIAGVFGNWTYSDGAIYQKKSVSRLLLFAISFFGFWAIVIGIVWLLVAVFQMSLTFGPRSYITLLALSFLISLIACYSLGGEHEIEVDYISLEDMGASKTRVLINLVDASGHPNFQEMELYKVLEQLETIY